MTLFEQHTCPGCGRSVSTDMTTEWAVCPFCGYRPGRDMQRETERGDAPSDTPNQGLPAPDESMPGKPSSIEDSIPKPEPAVVGASHVADGANAFDRLACPSCRAQMVIVHGMAEATCPHCGAAMQAMGPARDADVPQLVVPFSVDKEQAMRVMGDYFSGKLYLPPSFRSDVSRMQAVYVPFCLHEVSVSGVLRYVGKMQISKTSYVYKPVLAVGQGTLRSVPVDASSRMADSLMDSLAPYKLDALRPPLPQDLSSCLIELPDVPDELCARRAAALAKGGLREEMYIQTRFAVGGTNELISEHFEGEAEASSCVRCALPVWVLHSEFKGEHLLFAVNGQTGECVGNLPIDEKRRLVLLGLVLPGIWLLITFLLLLASTDSSGASHGETEIVVIFIALVIAFIGVMGDKFVRESMTTAKLATDTREGRGSLKATVTNLLKGCRWYGNEDEAYLRMRNAMSEYQRGE